MPNEPEGGGKTNQYFVDFYRGMTADLQGLEAATVEETEDMLTDRVPADARDSKGLGDVVSLYHQHHSLSAIVADSRRNTVTPTASPSAVANAR